MKHVCLSQMNLKSLLWFFFQFIQFLVLPCNINFGQCQHGGTCTNDNAGGFSCDCANGYTGEHCETGMLFVAKRWGSNIRL